MIGTVFPGFEVVPPQLKAGLIIVHGIAEHADRYRHVAEALTHGAVRTDDALDARAGLGLHCASVFIINIY
jgi:hypothetical protein